MLARVIPPPRSLSSADVRRNLHVDRVAVRVAQQRRDENVRAPLVLEQVRPELEREDARQRPPRLQAGEERALVEALAEPGEAEECDDVEDGRRDDEQVRAELDHG